MEEETEPDDSDQSTTFLQVATGLTAVTVPTYLSFAKSLTEKEKIVFYVSGSCCGAAFIAAMGGNVLASLGKTGRVSRSLTLTAGAANACAFSFFCGLMLPPHLMIWLPSGFSIFFTVAFAVAIAYACGIFGK